jgi:hypothetical protein
MWTAFLIMLTLGCFVTFCGIAAVTVEHTKELEQMKLDGLRVGLKQAAAQFRRQSPGSFGR